MQTYTQAWPIHIVQDRTRPVRDRGSVMLLVVVTLLMLAILGMSYLQVSRLDRVAASSSAKSYIDVVANASIAYIGEVLKNDVVTSDGVMLDRASGIETYDFPWTSNSQSFAVQYNDGTNATAKGGKLDDTWLASIEPDVSSHKATWPHITNLNGTFLLIPSSSGSVTAPQELAVDNENINTNNTWWNDTSVPVNVKNKISNLDYAESGYEKVGADADGDGIEDSKWTWAPIRQVSGISYVMAARIIDNSALLNMNVALSQVSAANTYAAEPLWLSPSELDFGNFAFSMGAGSDEIKAILTHRLLVEGSPLVSLPIDSNTQYNFWYNGAMLYDNYTSPYKKLGIINELELRYRNGLNNPKLTTTIEAASTGMEDFLRANASNETTYLNVPGVSKIDNFFDTDPRHQLTTVSGISVYRAALPNETQGVQKRMDLGYMLASTTDVAAPSIQTGRQYQFASNLYDFYINTGYSANVDTINSLARQMTTNFVDYADSDNRITQFYEYDVDGNNLGYSGDVSGTTAVYGMEALPFVTEVYTQRSCELSVDKEDYTIYYFTSNLDVVTAFANENNKPGFAIEIRNPYQNDISLNDVYLWVGNDATAQYELKLKFIADSYLADNVLKPNQILVLYYNSTGGSSTKHDISKLIASTSDVIAVDLSSLPDTSQLGNILFVDSESDKDSHFSAQLRATRQDGTKLTWGYCKIPIKQYVKNPMPEIIDVENWWIFGSGDSDLLEKNSDSYIESTTNRIQFTQTSSYANPQGLNALAYQANEWITRERDFFDPMADPSLGNYAMYLGYMTALDRLGLNDKSDDIEQIFKYKNTSSEKSYKPDIAGFTGEKYDPAKEYWTFTNSGIIDHVGDLLMVPLVGMQANTTFAATLASATESDDLRNDYMLNIFSNSNITATNTNVYFGMNFAQALLEQFVTISPESDGADNDADGLVDNQDTDELLIPGKINLNTATTRLLEQILPITSTSTRSDVVDAIETLRGKPSDNTPGIACISDLYSMNPSNWNYTGSYDNKTLIQRQLGSVASTRSDIFTAYVLIRGYPSGDFRKGAVESKRYFVVFDRSKVSSSSDRVQILGYYEFD